MGDIQNAALGEIRIRELNDKLNELMREKGRWEERIRKLGGADLRIQGGKIFDYEEYRYYGVAKDLPKVRELEENDKPQAPVRNYEDLTRKVGYEYFGYNDQDSEELLAKEQALEAELRGKAIEEYKELKAKYRENTQK
uniref:Pre-mRNA-splicing factor ISY1 n=1 Tax=Euplotes harpa TaxID=151035 RepID=A0A7S3N955_9SPIT|mmetsp:Transcript_25219/g.29076  ORF Transcript_25219/g.29076 Transcript_25219/m.29076 type:complete len:139 (+) Transcript_25219:179-595(+)